MTYQLPPGFINKFPVLVWPLFRMWILSIKYLVSNILSGIPFGNALQAMNPLDEIDRQRLLAYHWPGNVRELQNIIERGIITHVDGKFNLSALNSISVEAPINRSMLNKILTEPEMLELEKANIIKALNATNWKISGDNGAAQLLQVPATTLSSRIGKLGIRKTKITG